MTPTHLQHKSTHYTQPSFKTHFHLTINQNGMKRVRPKMAKLTTQQTRSTFSPKLASGPKLKKYKLLYLRLPPVFAAFHLQWLQHRLQLHLVRSTSSSDEASSVDSGSISCGKTSWERKCSIWEVGLRQRWKEHCRCPWWLLQASVKKRWKRHNCSSSP